MANTTRKHGEAWRTSRTCEYSIWQAMVQRCTNPNNKGYLKYGGRGIGVCDRWREYENFLADMGRRPSDSHSLDRINNDKGYEPSNCRWATLIEQANNTRTNKHLTFRGRTQTVADWAREIGIKQNTLVGRIRKGWSVEKALTAPIDVFMQSKTAGVR
jgi:hypothetical protein